MVSTGVPTMKMLLPQLVTNSKVSRTPNPRGMKRKPFQAPEKPRARTSIIKVSPLLFGNGADVVQSIFGILEIPDRQYVPPVNGKLCKRLVYRCDRGAVTESGGFRGGGAPPRGDARALNLN